MPLRENVETPGAEGPSVALQILQEVQYALERIMRQRGYFSTMGSVELFDYRTDPDGKAGGNSTQRPSCAISRELSSSPAPMGCCHRDYTLTCLILVRFDPEPDRSTLETSDTIELDILRALHTLPDWCGPLGPISVDADEDDPNAFLYSVEFRYTTDGENFALSGHP